MTVEPCISSNTYYRCYTENDFSKDISKFLSDSVFGRLIQSQRNEKDITIVANEKI